MWVDLQQTFLIVLGPFIQNILLPVFLAAVVAVAIILPVVRTRRDF